MVYPGDPELTADAQERVLSAFRRAVAMFQEGNREEARIALDFALRLDPSFQPARSILAQLEAGATTIDLAAVLSQIQTPSEEDIRLKLVDAVDDFNARRFLDAKAKAEAVLRELPGNQEARRLLEQATKALADEATIGRFLARARELLDAGRPGEAADQLMRAQAIDPHHPGIAPMLAEIQRVGPPPAAEEAGTVTAGDTAAAAPELSFADVQAGPPAGAAGSTPEGPPTASEHTFAPAEESGAAFTLQGPSELEIGEEPPAAQLDAAAGGTPTDLDDVADLFEDEPPAGTGVLQVTEEAAPDASGGGRIQELLAQGWEAFERGDYREAIDIWSRIYLIDPDNQAANEAVDRARRLQDELDRRLEQRFFEAQESADAGDAAKARRVLEGILAEQPDHLAARQLLEELTVADTQAAAAETGTAGPRDAGEMAPEAVAEALDVDLEEAGEALGGEAAPPPPPVKTAAKRVVSLRLVLLAVAGLIVVGLAIWFGSRLTAGRGRQQQAQSLDRVLARAEALYRKGRPEEAVRLLEAFGARGTDQARVARRLAKYRRAMAPPTPTPVPEEARTAEQQYAAGNWLASYRTAEAGLKKHPGDEGLKALENRILRDENLIGSLVQAEADGDYESAAGIAQELVARYPDHGELRKELARDLFNLAVTRLRSYDLTGAESQLHQLLKIEPGDREARRVLEFIAAYRARPVDMRLKVFIGSLSLR